MSMSMKKMKETFFITHGAPMVAVDESFPVRNFLSSWKEKVLPNIIPKSILLISAHWDTSVPTVNVISNGNVNDTIYDFDNIPLPLPNSLYQLKYPAPGAPELAKRVKELLTESGFNHVDEDKTRGLDHAAWVPLMLMYPEANIPVCQLSVQSSKDATHHYNMGRALAPLKEEGVLIIGSGAATHNFSDCSSQDDSVASWAMEFDTWLKLALLQGRYEDVNRYEEKAPYAKRAHPQPDHFYPLHVAMGAAGEDAKANLIYQSWGSSVFSYASYQFTTATPS